MQATMWGIATRGREKFLDVHRCRRCCPGVEHRIAISDEKARSFVPRKRFAELLRGPRGRGMVNDGGVHDASTFVSQNHQDKQEPTCRGRHDEEIGSGDLPDVVR